MKKFLKVFVPVLLVAVLAVVLSFALTAEPTNVLYIADQARGNGSGSDADNAMGNTADYATKFASDDYTVNKAAFKESAFFLALDQLKDTGGKIVIVGPTSVECCETAAKSSGAIESDKSTRTSPSEFACNYGNGQIVITSKDAGHDYREDGAKLILSQKVYKATALCLKTPTTFENLNIHYEQATSYPAGSWYTKNFLIQGFGKGLTMGEGLTVTSTDGVNFPSIIGGHRYSALTATYTVTIKSGTWNFVIAGGHGMAATGNTGAITGNVTLNVDGGKINTIYGNGSVIRPHAAVNGTLTININNGSVGQAIGDSTGKQDGAKGTINYRKGTIAASKITKFESTNPTGNPILTFTNAAIPSQTSPAAVAKGTSLTITAGQAPAQQEFYQWKVSGGLSLNTQQKTTNPLTFTMPELDATIEATFRDANRTLEVVGGTITGKSNPASVLVGDSVEVSASPASNQLFKKWVVTSGELTDVTLTNETLSFDMPKTDLKLTAEFDTLYQVNVENGKADGIKSGSFVKTGTKVKVTANEAPEGQEFYKWEITGVSGLTVTNKSLEFDIVENDVTLVATYRDSKTHNVTVNGGKAKAVENSQYDEVEVTADAPAKGKIFDHWETKGITLGNNTAKTVKFDMPAEAVELTAVYRDAVLSVLKVTDAEITGYEGTEAEVYEGEMVAVTANIGDDYQVTNWAVTPSVSTSTDGNTLTFEMPANGVEVKYTAENMFEKLPVVYVASNGTGNGSSPDKPIGNSENYEKLVKLNDATAYKESALYRAVEKVMSGGTVVLVGEVRVEAAEAFRATAVEFQMPKATGTIKFTSYYGGVDFAAMKDDKNPDYKGARLIIDQTLVPSLNIAVPFKSVWSDLTIEYISSQANDPYCTTGKTKPTTIIMFNGNKTVIGENVTTIAADGQSYPSLCGGNRYSKVSGTDLTVKSGTWQYVFAGGHGISEANNAAVTGNAKLVVDGAEIQQIYGTTSKVLPYSAVFGDLTVVVKSGKVYKAQGALTDEEPYGDIIFNPEALNQFKIHGFATMNPPKGDPTLDVTNGTVEGLDNVSLVKVGTPVKVVANAPASGMRFYKWDIEGLDDDIDLKLNAKQTTLEFEMPEADLTFVALYKDINAGYEVNITGGSIAGYEAKLVEIKAGTSVTVMCDAPEKGMRFAYWELLGSEDPMSTCSKVSFVMPSDDVILTAVYEVDPFANLPVIYISDNGTGDGSTPDAPLGNKSGYAAKVEAEDMTAYKDTALYQAFQKLEKTGGTIVFVGDVAVEVADAKRNSPAEATMPATTGPVKLTSVYDGVDYRDNAKLILDQSKWESTNLCLKSESYWENLNILYKPGTAGEWYGAKSKNYPNESMLIQFSGFKTVIGEGITVTSADGKCFPSLVAGHRYSKVNGTNLTVKSGTWDMVFAGGHGMNDTNNGQVNGDAYLLVDGGDVAINTIYGVTSALKPTAKITGKLEVKVNLGKVNKAYGAVEEGKKFGTIKYNENSISAANIKGFETVIAFGSIASATSPQTGSWMVYAIIGAAIALAGAVLVLNKKKIRD